MTTTMIQKMPYNTNTFMMVILLKYLTTNKNINMDMKVLHKNKTWTNKDKKMKKRQNIITKKFQYTNINKKYL